MKTDAKPKALLPTVRRLMGYMKNSRLLILITVFSAVAETIMQVTSPKLLGNVTTLIFDGIRLDGIDFTALFRILTIIAFLYLGIFITSFLQQRLMNVVSQKTVLTLRNALKAKMNKVPIAFFDKYENGQLMSVASNDIDNIASNLQQSLTDVVSSAILAVGVLSFMLSISPLLTLLACAMLPGTLLVMKWFTPRTKEYNMQYMKKTGELNGRIEEAYQGFLVLKSFNGKQRALESFDEINSDMYNAGWKAKFFGGCMTPSMMLLQNAIYVLIAAIGAVKVVSGNISIGDMQAFLQYSQQFTSPIAWISRMWGNFLAALSSAERVFALLDAEEMHESRAEFPDCLEAPKVVFDNVKFGYTDELLMKGFELRVTDGQTIAIVGHTGAGKTTLINLLERFYEIKGGSIRIDGMDIRNISRSELRSKIGMVLQDTWLFSGSIYENIKFGNANAAEEQVYAAAKAAFADEFIQKLPDGYQTILNEEAGNISQGQRQLLTIARAFVANPEILILDEATSNVDSRTEMIVQKAMKELMKGRTSFVVAHRLSTIYDADSIIVMKNGDIVETGAHKDLLLKNGVYADIYRSQFEQEVA